MTNKISLKFILCTIICLGGMQTMRSQVTSNGSIHKRGTQDGRYALTQASQLAHLEAINIGPTVFSGRVSDIDVNPQDPSEFLVAYASGGLWYTKNHGITFDPIFDHESVMTIGDIAVDWTSKTLYVGTGEQNSSRSSYAGNGIYKSTDMGKHWQHLGLEDTHHIGKVIIHPENNNKIWVAAIGPLYSLSPDRGVYMSENGGESWQKTLMIDDSTGIIDMVVDPMNPDILYAASWTRIRKAWHFTGNGIGSAIYKSIDGGMKWTMITSASSGFPVGEGVGRIGLSLSKAQGQNYLYAIVDNNALRSRNVSQTSSTTHLDHSAVEKMSSGTFLNQDTSVIKKYIKKLNLPRRYTYEKVVDMLNDKTIEPIDLAQYNKDANDDLTDTPIIGPEVYVTNDEGNTWRKTHTGYIDDVYYTYGYYFGQIRSEADNPLKLYIFGVPILRSEDGGQTWINISAPNVHGDHHALWINPSRPGHIIDGNDGGLNISYDDGDNWIKCNQPPVGQFYYITTDRQKPYNVYGGTQDNGVWKGPSNYIQSTRWHGTGHYPYQMLLGGDGMQVQVDPFDANNIYTGFQFGNYFRINLNTQERQYITPKHDLGHKKYRWNWMTPILHSTHQKDVIYMGAQFVLRSFNQGKDFVKISPDLTYGGRKGNVPYGSITTLSESPLAYGVLYAGTDDGRIWCTRNAGFEWQEISTSLPQGYWVSRVWSSSHDSATVYVSLNGYRQDDFGSYAYKSNDYGKSWQKLGVESLQEPINVIKDDPRNDNILYIGTDHGVYYSFDQGQSFYVLSSSLPNTPVHDLVFQVDSHDLVIGTHGRSIYKINTQWVDQLVDVHVDQCKVFDAHHTVLNKWGKVQNVFTPIDTGRIAIPIFSPTGQDGVLSILNDKNTIVKQVKINLLKGLAWYMISARKDESKNKKAISTQANTNGTSDQNDGFEYLSQGQYSIELRYNQNKALGKLTLSD